MARTSPKPHSMCITVVKNQGIEEGNSQFSVVTPLRGDRDPSSQHCLERPEMICQPQGHRRRPVVRAMHTLPSRQQPRPMSPLKVVIEERPRPRVHRRLASRLANACVLRVRAPSRSRNAPLSRSTCTVPAGPIPAPSAARISTDSSRPCASRCLTVCVNVTVAGTTHAGRPRLPVNRRWRYARTRMLP
jgi:hypothetical protein